MKLYVFLHYQFHLFETSVSFQGLDEVSVRKESHHIEQPSQLPHNFETTFRILFLQVIFKDLPMTTLRKDEMEYDKKRNPMRYNEIKFQNQTKLKVAV
jgi:hypothetical protein